MSSRGAGNLLQFPRRLFIDILPTNILMIPLHGGMSWKVRVKKAIWILDGAWRCCFYNLYPRCTIPSQPVEAATHPSTRPLFNYFCGPGYSYTLPLRFLFKRARISLPTSAGGCSKRGRPTPNVTFLIYSTWKHVWIPAVIYHHLFFLA